MTESSRRAGRAEAGDRYIVRFGRSVYQALGLVVAAGVALSACAGGEDEGESRDRNDAPQGWSVCNELFGAGRIDRLQDEMGGGTLAVLNAGTPVGELMSGRASVARSWKPGSEAHYANTSRPCDLGIDGTSKRFHAYVSWSVDSPEDIRAGDAGEGWQSLGKDVYVRREDGGLHLTAAIPCKIEGSHKAQEAELPLEVETEVRNVPEFDTELLSEMTAQLARKLAHGLPCRNDPAVPSEL
ncbi:hypothetical protein L0F81_18865 [Streptomyces tricolor]|uniref:Lipoprotein n=1 Tax=Streptomyces tricolor TaxID=68277 RepID=A0ABS9JID1_9ACTN|nr:hypothetical protein [Streptomyces tricolor]MCG0065330.1 hypothetical protein [Streptomyces tricolor]